MSGGHFDYKQHYITDNGNRWDGDMISIKQTDRKDRYGNQIVELVIKKGQNNPWIHEVSPQELIMLKNILNEYYDNIWCSYCGKALAKEILVCDECNSILSNYEK